jgi:hypothetical protein
MSDRQCESKKAGDRKGKPGDLALDVARLAEETGLDTSDVYAFLCGGSAGSGGSSDWLDREVSDDVLKHLRFLDE